MESDIIVIFLKLISELKKESRWGI